MKTTLLNLNEEASETLNFMLDTDYLDERIRKIDSIEDFLMDQWRDFQTLSPEKALDFLDTLRCLRKDFTTLLHSFTPEGTE